MVERRTAADVLPARARPRLRQVHQRRSARLFVGADQPQSRRQAHRPHRRRGCGVRHVPARLGHASGGHGDRPGRFDPRSRRDWSHQVTTALDQPYRGGFIGNEHRFALTVYFEDTDTAGVVYYANYLKFMERARSDMIRAVGVDQRQVLESGGGAYYVAEANIRYVRSAKLGD